MNTESSTGLTNSFLTIVDSSVFLTACSEVIDVGADGAPDQTCGLVRQSVAVTAQQIVEPFESLLRIQILSVLRRVINSGDFVDYIPESCLGVS